MSVRLFFKLTCNQTIYFLSLQGYIYVEHHNYNNVKPFIHGIVVIRPTCFMTIFCHLLTSLHICMSKVFCIKRKIAHSETLLRKLAFMVVVKLFMCGMTGCFFCNKQTWCNLNRTNDRYSFLAVVYIYRTCNTEISCLLSQNAFANWWTYWMNYDFK